MKYKLLLVDDTDDIMGIAASGQKYDKLRPAGDEIFNPHAYEQAGKTTKLTTQNHAVLAIRLS